jgi:ribA/ribD-fused uncharacterized protein
MEQRMINSFRGQYNFLSNFFSCTVIVGGDLYPSVEHAFQALKAVREADRVSIQRADSPAIAKRMGKQVRKRPDWDEVRVQFMLDCLHAKFNDPELRRALLATGDEILVEGNWWGDKFWGVCDNEGENWLGQLLMHVRWEIRRNLV